MEWWSTAIGLLAGGLTTASFMPQVVRIWRRRSANDLSLTASVMFTIGITCWLIYGIQLHALPIIIANAVTRGLNLSILGLKVRHG